MKATLPSTADIAPRTSTSRRSARKPDVGMTSEELMRRYLVVCEATPDTSEGQAPGIAYRNGSYLKITATAAPRCRDTYTVDQTPLRPIEALLIVRNVLNFEDYSTGFTDDNYNAVGELLKWVSDNVVEKGDPR